jgi:hypothetical protein
MDELPSNPDDFTCGAAAFARARRLLAAKVPISDNPGQWRYWEVDLRFVAGRCGGLDLQKSELLRRVERITCNGRPSLKQISDRSSHMSKFIAAAVALVLAAGLMFAASATPQEDAYFAARDKYLKKFDKADFSKDATDKEMARAIDDLKDKLEAIIGPVALKGSGVKPHNNLDSLSSGDDTFGHLDGLAFGAPGNQQMTVVSTEGLLKSWLTVHKSWWGKDEEKMPQVPAAALKTEGFYTQAIGFDAAFQFYTELPIAKPASASFAVSYLYVTAQDFGPWKPDGILAAVIQGGRIYIVTTPVKPAVPSIAACDAIWKAADKKSEGKGDFDAIRKQADTDFHRCFAEHVRTMPLFTKLTADAQTMVDALPLK